MEGQSCASNGKCDLYLSCSEDDFICQHDGVFGHVDALLIICYILIPLIVGISNVGGIGGGIVKVPILVLLLNYSTSQSTNIAYPITLGGCLANIYLLLQEKHPNQSRPLIDFGIAMILVPNLLIGTNTGVIMNQVLPELFLNGFFIIFLMVVCPYLGMKVVKTYQLEQKLKKQFNLIRQKSQNLEDISELENSSIKNKLIKSDSIEVEDAESEISMQEKYNQYLSDLINSVTELNVFFQDSRQLRKNRALRWEQRSISLSYLPSQLREKSPLALQNIKEEEYEEEISMENLKIQEQKDGEDSQNSSENRSILKLNRARSAQTFDEASFNDSLNVNNVNNNFMSEFRPPKQNIEQELNVEENITTNNPKSSILSIDNNIQTSQNLNKIIEDESKKIPTKKLLFLVFCLSIVLLFSFILGNKSIFGFKKCDAGYFTFFVLQYVILIALAFFAWNFMRNEIQSKKDCFYNFDENDITDMNLSVFLKISGAGFFAGFIGGMIGVGAGLVLVPVLLLLKVHPRIAAATSGLSYFFISFTSILNVLTSNSLSIAEISLFTLLALVGGSIISPIVYYLVNKFQRHSFVILIVLMIAILNIICTIIYVFQMVGFYKEQHWSLTSCNNYCEVQGH